MKAKTELRNRLTGALAIFGLLAGGLAFTDTAAARSPYQQVCWDAWHDSPAEDVCAESSVSRVGNSTGNDRGNCLVNGISCSLSATNQAEDTVTWTLGSRNSNRSPSDTETLDMCFAAKTNSEGDITGYKVNLKAGCATGEITSDNMEGSTLPY